MKGTRLWQSTGSPLISGRSRWQRPFWQPWLLASLVSAVAVGAWLGLEEPQLAFGVLAGVMLAAAFAGAAAGVWVSRLAGWGRSWIVGAGCGIALAAVALALTALPVFSAMRMVVL